MYKACILGGGGYFGQYVAMKFQKEGYHVNILDVSIGSTPPNVTLEKERISVFEGSVLDESLLESALSGCSVCVHIAAFGMGGKGALDREAIFRVNVDGTNLAMDVCRRLRVKRFVNSSSVGVIFTDKELHMADESHPYPEKYYSFYSESKAVAERAVKAANCSAFSTVSLRFRGIFGPGEPRATNRAAEAIYRGLYLAEFDRDRPAMTQYSGLDNTATACVLADQALKEKPHSVGGKVYTIVDGGPPVESFGFWNPLIKALGRRPPSVRVPFAVVFYFAWLCEMAYLHFGVPPLLLRLEVALMGITNTYSIEAARRDLGYDPTHNHDTSEVCSYYADFFTTHPIWAIDWLMTAIAIVAISFIVFLF